MKEKLGIALIVILAALCLFGCSDTNLKPEDMVYLIHNTHII